MTNDHAEQLCRHARNGNRSAATELISLFYEKIYGYHRRLCPNDHDAADLTQRTFAKAWHSLERFEERSRFSTWLHSIAHHVYVDWCRQPRPFEPRTDDWWSSCPAPDPDPAESLVRRDGAAALYRAVNQLDPTVRQTVHLHYYQGLSLADTAEVLDVAVSTVKHRLREAINRLKQLMREPEMP
jgi:RNA polymerase sigma-70 factor (ECF subfamily)